METPALDKKTILRHLESIKSFVDDIARAMDRLEEAFPDGTGVTVPARIPEPTQHPVGHMIAQELLPDQVEPLKSHSFERVVNFALMSLDVELPNLMAAIEERDLG